MEHDEFAATLATVPLPPTIDASPVVLHSLIEGWIARAQDEDEMPGDEKEFPTCPQPFGVIRGDSRLEALQVSVHFKRLNRRRHLLLHFVPGDSFRQNVKEVGFIYFGAATGSLTGMHISAGHRGRGFMKLLFAYYLCFCKSFRLAATDTAHNKKPSFAKLFVSFGYKPCCTDFPFLLFRVIEGQRRVERHDDLADERQKTQNQPASCCCVLTLPAENPRRPPTKGRIDRAWAFPESYAASQDLRVMVAPSHTDPDTKAESAEEPTTLESLAIRSITQGGRLEGDVVKLYAKTAWELPDPVAVAHRDAAVAQILKTHQSRCLRYSL